MSSISATSEYTTAPVYYVKNFLVVLDTVAELYQDLLNDQERSFLNNCYAMPRPALRLFLRLHSRVGNCFRSDKINYAEVPDLLEAAQTLADHGLLRINGGQQPDYLLDLLLKKEILELLDSQVNEPKTSHTLLKKELLQRAQQLPQSAILDFCRSRFSWFQLQTCYVLDLFKLLFFGNWHQDLTEFIQTDLGIKRYEMIELGLDQRLFPDRAHIESALRYRYLQRYVERPQIEWDPEAIQHLLNHLPETYGHPFLERRKGKICNAVGYFLEKAGHRHMAMTAYAATEMPPARERFIRLQIHRGDWESALVQTILLSRTAVDDREMQYAQRAKRQIQNALRLKPDQIRPVKWPEYQLSINPKPGESVERAAIQALTAEGREAFFAENRFWLNLLGLTFWDIVFMNVKGVFLNPFQRGPIDLWHPEFAQRRAAQIDQRLDEMRDGRAWLQQIQATFEAKQGIHNHMVYWPSVNWQQIQKVQKAIKQPALIKIFERMIKNLKYYRVGLPDLIVFKKGRMQLVEVKSPNDRLSPHQIGWLSFFCQNRIDCAVARVIPSQGGRD